MKRARADDTLAQMNHQLPRTFHPNNSNVFDAAYGKSEQGGGLQQPCFGSEAQIPAVPHSSGTDKYAAIDGCSSAYPPPRMTPFNMPGQLQLPQQQPYQASSSMFMPPGSVPMMSGSSSNLRAVSGQLDRIQQPMSQYSTGLPPVQDQGPAHARSASPGNLLSQLRAQQQQQQQQPGLLLRLPQDLKPLHELQRLLPRLNQEYKQEMQLLLQACQIASRVQRQNPAAVGPNGNVLLLNPASRDQLQHQVLSNCNDKHRAVTAAFRLAAQAVAAAVSSMAATARPSAVAAAAAAVDIFGGAATASSSSNVSSLTAAVAATREDPECERAAEAVSEALQQLRSSYHQELVAATSALFAICRGFGQSSTVAAAASQPIKQALAAAQQQHNRVEQLWQDVLLTAAGGQ